MISTWNPPCCHNLTACACNSTWPLHIIGTVDPVDELEKKRAMEPQYFPPPAPVVPAFRRALIVSRPEFHARSNPR